jgi:putative transposase
MWVEPDIRDCIIDYIEHIAHRSDLSYLRLIKILGITRSRFYEWKQRKGVENRHNGKLPKSHWILPFERKAIIDYCRHHLEEGYRRLTYMMLDADTVAVSPSTTYRVLKEAGLLNRWPIKTSGKGKGFVQPAAVHDHWHVDISYVNILGTIFFLITVMDGASRYILHHELRTHMTEYDVEITIERAKEKFADARPRVISYNGPQFLSKGFKEYMRLSGFTHVHTAPYYPQSNGKLERFHGTIKQEAIRRSSYINLEDARCQIEKYISYYNTKRLHSAIYYLTPDDVLLGRTKQRLKIREEKLEQARLERYKMRKCA